MADNCRTVRIRGWANYNPRKDFKSPRWFALNNRILEDSDFFDFDGDEFKSWIYILCQCSQKNKDEVTISFDHANRVCGISRKKMISAIQKLQDIEIIQYVQTTNANVQEKYFTEQNNTEQTIQNNTEQDEPDAETPARLFPFSNLIYFEEISKIKESIITEWAKEFDHNFLNQEISKAKLWCMANEKKKPKDSTRFLNNWFSKGWEDYRKKIPSVTPITKNGEMSEASKIAFNRLKEKGLV